MDNKVQEPSEKIFRQRQMESLNGSVGHGYYGGTLLVKQRLGYVCLPGVIQNFQGGKSSYTISTLTSLSKGLVISSDITQSSSPGQDPPLLQLAVTDSPLNKKVTAGFDKTVDVTINGISESLFFFSTG